MRRILLIAIIVALVLLTGILGYSYLANQTQSQNGATATVTPQSPIPTGSGTPSPPPQGTLIDETGPVTDVIGQVGYKNALAIVVSGTTVYLTPSTKIIGPDNQSLNRSAIREGVRIVVLGEPTEGGIEASQVTVLSPVTPRSSTPTPTP